MATRTTPATTALLLCTSLCGCDASVETLDDVDAPEPEFRALTTERGVSLDVVTWPREAMGPAARSEGYLMVRLQGGPASTGPASPPQPDDILGTCGVTFVSPNIAVTAGHCLPGLAENELVEVRVGRALPGYVPDGEISGTFPNYQHEGPLDPVNGSYHEDYDWHYDYDQYQCAVKSRCFDDLPEINCDITHPGVPALSDNTPDIGIIQCLPWGSGPHRHDYVNVADSVATDDLVAMPWYHELYDPDSPGLDGTFATNYIADAGSAGGYGNHYHYRGGGERHEMLPLMSADYYGDRWKVTNVYSSGRVWTNLIGCHGTSGSGVMKKDSGDYPELIGPVTIGGGNLSGRLCQSFNPETPDISSIATIRPDITDYFVHAYIPSDCAQPDSFPSRLAYWLTCDRHMLGNQTLDLVELFPLECQVCELIARMNAASNMGMRMSAMLPIGLGLRPNKASTPHRASVRVWVDSFPTTVELRLGNQVIAERELVGQEQFVGNYATVALSGSFMPESTTDELTLTVQQGSAAKEIVVSDIVLVQDGAAGAFESMHNRFGFGLVNAYDQQPVATLMSFGGSADGGIAALLDEDERMLATGYALVPDQQWTITPIGDELDMLCGMIFEDGHELAQSCYGNEPITLDAVGHGEPIALFVQNTEAGKGPISLSDFIVEQAAPPSCTPPAHDRCETGAAMSQPSCDPCVESICTVDPYCCSTSWDSICVGEVGSVCNESCSTCAHEPCQTGPALETGCDGQQGCVTSICNADPYCCGTYWDSICVGAVGSVCGQQC